MMSKVCSPTSSRSGSSTPSTSWPSRLSISPQLVEVATIVAPFFACGARRATRFRRYLRAGVEVAVGLQRQPAAALRRHDHPVAVVLEHLRPSSCRAADRCCWPRSRGSRRPCPSGSAAGGACAPTTGTCERRIRAAAASRWMPRVFSSPTRNGLISSDRLASGAIGRDRAPRAPWAGDHLVAQRHALLGLHLGPGLGVDLGDVHVLRADLGADAAARAVVERGVDRVLGAAKPLALRAGVLRAGKQRRDGRDRAERLAHRALDAAVE